MLHLRLWLILGVSVVPGLLEGHARLLAPVPRTVNTLKVGPCGGIRRTSTPLVLRAGQELTIVWEEYIDHPGYYQILFSAAGDRDFVMLKDRIADVPIPSGRSFIEYSTVVTLPSTPCEEGTLQLIQVMTENPQAPQLYFSCADIRLVDPSWKLFRRGDPNGDGAADLSDAVAVLLGLFVSGGSFSCAASADANASGAVDIADAIRILEVLFRSGPPFPAPGPRTCGPDPEEPVAADCEEYPPCGG